MRVIILITAKDKKEADKIATLLIKNKLAACVNIVGGLKSIYLWKGKIEQAKETLLIVKSRKDKFDKIVKLARSVHSYEVPEIIAVPITNGFKPYLRWIDESLTF
jgi:periplasmic divalent cation tolerance protein